MLLDLVSPWRAAVEATDPLHATTAFRTRHAALLENLRRQRAPADAALPLATDPVTLRRAASRAADSSRQQLLRDTLAAAQGLGAAECGRIVLLAGDGTGHTVEPLPWPDGDVVLFLDRTDDERQLIVALARATAAVTRWRTADATSRMRPRPTMEWDRWRAASEAPLREWIYTTGIGLHLASALAPTLSPHELFGLGRVAFDRLRQRERAYRALLGADLDHSGLGLVLRWLTPGAPVSARTFRGTVLPPMAGRYLAWRMVADRVGRVGLREAIRAEA